MKGFHRSRLKDAAFPRLFQFQSLGLMTPRQTQKSLNDWIFGRLNVSSEQNVNNRVHSSSLTCMDLDKEEARYLVVGGSDGSIYIHDIHHRSGNREDGDNDGLLLHIGRSSKHRHSLAISGLAWGNDSGMFLSCGRNAEVRIWDTNRAIPVESFNIGSQALDMSFQRESLSLALSCSQKNYIQLLDLKSGSFSHVLRGGHGDRNARTLSWSPVHQNILCSGGADGRVVLWDVRMAKSFLRYLDCNRISRRLKKGSLKAAGWSHNGSVLGVSWSQCGHYLFSAGTDKRIRKWNWSEGINMKTEFPEISLSESIRRTDLICTEETLLVLAQDISALNQDSGNLIRTLSPSKNHSCFAFNPHQLELCSAKRKQIYMWTPVVEYCDKSVEVEHLVEDAWSDDSDD